MSTPPVKAERQRVGHAIGREGDPGIAGARVVAGVAVLPPAQREKNGALLRVQELPPSKEAATPIAWEPPLDQRFCCQVAIRLELLAGLTAICGSTGRCAVERATGGHAVAVGCQGGRLRDPQLRHRRISRRTVSGPEFRRCRRRSRAFEERVRRRWCACCAGRCVVCMILRPAAPHGLMKIVAGCSRNP